MINGAYLKQLRLSNHYTLTQLSAMTGYTPSFLSQIERGLKEPSLSTLRKLSECFSVPLISFFRSNASLNRDRLREKASVQIVQRDMREKLSIPGMCASLEAITLPNQKSDGSLSLNGYLCSLPSTQWYVNEDMAHYQDQCFFILKGNILFQSKEITLCVDEGDSLFVKADTPFNFQNTSDEDCLLIIFRA